MSLIASAAFTSPSPLLCQTFSPRIDALPRKIQRDRLLVTACLGEGGAGSGITIPRLPCERAKDFFFNLISKDESERCYKKIYIYIYVNVISRGRSVGEEFELCELVSVACLFSL